jgi:hypothetical protein
MAKLSAAGTARYATRLDRVVTYDPLDGQILNILEVGSGTGQNTDVDAAIERARTTAPPTIQLHQ